VGQIVALTVCGHLVKPVSLPDLKKMIAEVRR
jgi:hypothetical protein